MATARDRDSFEKRLVEFAHALDFPIITAILVVERPSLPAQFVTAGNVPEAYKASYNDPELGRQSPVGSRLKHLGHPFTYDQAMYVHDGAGHLWEHQAAFGFKTGIAMAMHMDRGRHFLLGVDREEPLPSDEMEVTRMMADLQLLGAFAQETAVRLLTPVGETEGEMPTLTQRELDCLRWTSEGKGAEVIGEILNLNRGTVNFHLQSARNKLSTTTTLQAVAKAIRLGLL